MGNSSINGEFFFSSLLRLITGGVRTDMMGSNRTLYAHTHIFIYIYITKSLKIGRVYKWGAPQYIAIELNGKHIGT